MDLLESENCSENFQVPHFFCNLTGFILPYGSMILIMDIRNENNNKKKNGRSVYFLINRKV